MNVSQKRVIIILIPEPFSSFKLKLSKKLIQYVKHILLYWIISCICFLDFSNASGLIVHYFDTGLIDPQVNQESCRIFMYEQSYQLPKFL